MCFERLCRCKVPENVNAKAVLVSGPPGIGKTTACRLVAEELGYVNIIHLVVMVSYILDTDGVQRLRSAQQGDS